MSTCELGYALDLPFVAARMVVVFHCTELKFVRATLSALSALTVTHKGKLAAQAVCGCALQLVSSAHR